MRKQNNEDVMIYKNKVIFRKDLDKFKQEFQAKKNKTRDTLVQKAAQESNDPGKPKTQWLEETVNICSSDGKVNLIVNKSTSKKKRKTKKNPRIKNLKIIYSNVDSLSNKKEELETILHKDDIDVALICETLPKNPTSAYNKENNFIFEGFETIENNAGRGVCIIYKESLVAKELSFITNIYSPSIFMSFQTKDKELNLGIIYRSPNATEQEDDLMRKQISTATRE